MTNYNSWTWAQPGYVPKTSQSLMNFNSWSADYDYAVDPYTSFYPNSTGSYIFTLDEFGFGKTDQTAKTEFYEDLMNFDYDLTKFGILQNSSSLALNFRGLGLPEKSFNRFANLLSVVSKGESTCLAFQSGYCALSRPCASYPDLWEYDFKVRWHNSNDTNYLRVPLATFAANYEQEGGVCVVFVEFLDPSYQDSKTIMFGGMFF